MLYYVIYLPCPYVYVDVDTLNRIPVHWSSSENVLEIEKGVENCIIIMSVLKDVCVISSFAREKCYERERWKSWFRIENGRLTNAKFMIRFVQIVKSELNEKFVCHEEQKIGISTWLRLTIIMVPWSFRSSHFRHLIKIREPCRLFWVELNFYVKDFSKIFDQESFSDAYIVL